MKFARPLLLTIGAAALPSAAAADTSTAAGQASATVVEPLRTVPLDDLSFGTLTVGVATGGEVQVSAAGSSASYSGTAAPSCGLAMQCSPHAARFAVSGEANRSYRVQLPVLVQARGARTGQLLDVSRLVVRSQNRAVAHPRGLLDSEGGDEFTIGGRLTVPAATRPDTFRAEIAVSVSYD